MIGIVAHIARQSQAEALAYLVDAEVLSVDDGTLGCTGNHKRVWEQLANSEDEWSVVLEDDALPASGFTTQLAQALHVAPTPIVSLYLGESDLDEINLALKQNTCWITSNRMLHAVGIAMHTNLIPDMLQHLGDKDIDREIGVWARDRDLLIGYTNPSLVDHADTPSLINHRPGRIAANTGTRPIWDTTATDERDWRPQPEPKHPSRIHVTPCFR